MIVFKNGVAYSGDVSSISNYDATVDETTWSYYCNDDIGTSWDVKDGVFIQKKSIESIINTRNTQKRISEIKRELSDTDYKCMKFADGSLSEEEYAPIRKQRQMWRDEINRLESELI